MATENSIKALTDEIFSLPDPEIEEPRREGIVHLVQATINGDVIIDHLSINASVKPDVMGILVYVLTDRRIIKFDIDLKNIKSVSYPLDTITGIERSLEGDRAGLELSFQTGSFGLDYTQPNPGLERFFQKVDQARMVKIRGATPNGA